MSAEFLPELSGSQVQLQIAWAADLTDLSNATWSWTDVTADVRADPGISYSIGRADEQASITPAKLSCTLDNSAAKYSQGGESPNWPNVRRNVPVRVRIDSGSGYVVVWRGFAVGFTPEWEAAGRIPVVRLEATGVWRRVLQRKDPLSSALYRFHTVARGYNQTPTDYWPLEEDKGATEASSPVGSPAGQFQPLDSGGTFYGGVQWGADDTLPATLRAPELEPLGTLVFPARQGLYSPGPDNHQALTWSMKITADSGMFVRWHVGDSYGEVTFYMIFYTDGSYELYRVDEENPGGELLADGDLGQPYQWDGVWRHYSLHMLNYATSDSTDGTSLWLHVDGVQHIGVWPFDVAETEFYARTRAVEFALPAAEGPSSIAHVALWDDADRVVGGLLERGRWLQACLAYDGETAQARYLRLCIEHDIGASASDYFGSAADTKMGPQLPGALPGLITECEVADQGVVYDGTWQSDVRFVPRSARENATSSLTIPPTSAVKLAPVDDDQRTLNRVTVNTSKGGQYTHEDVDGPMGTEAVGIYDAGADANLSEVAGAAYIAGWLVHLGTVEGYRYPEIAVDLRAAPSLAAAVLSLQPSDCVTLSDPSAVFLGLPPGDVRLLVEGLQVQLAPKRAVVTIRCSLAAGWDIGTVAAATGDTGLDSMRLLPDGTTTTSSAAAGATSLAVSTPSGPRWTTTSDDYPLYLDVGGSRVRATACSGTGASQTFTVDALPIARASGSRVTVWDPPVLGL